MEKRTEQCAKRGVTMQPQVLVLGDSVLSANTASRYLATRGHLFQSVFGF